MKQFFLRQIVFLTVFLPKQVWAQEPYAVLSGDTISGVTVTFYYDDQKAARGGMDINSDPYSSPYGTATTAVIDASFADYRPARTDYWFAKCSSLTTISGMEYLNTSNVENMVNMFGDCSSLSSLDLSHFNTDKAKQMGGMFDGCSSLTSLDLSSFNTTNVLTMWNMFDGCSSLTSLDLTGFDTPNLEWMEYMFNGCSSLTTIYTGSEWNTANVTESGNMFRDCTNLVGGKGTVYNASHTDAEYARIDGGPNSETPGYFTDKNAPTDGTTIYVRADVAPHLYAFSAVTDQALNGNFPGNIMADTVNVGGETFWATTIATTEPFEINLSDTEGVYRTHEIYVVSDRFFTYDGASDYADVTAQYGQPHEIAITSLALPGDHNSWNRNDLFEAEEPGIGYQTDLDLSDYTADSQLFGFKLFANGGAWLGTTALTINAPEYVSPTADTQTWASGRNVTIDLSATSVRRFHLEAVWAGGSDMEHGWTLTVSELPDAEPEPYAVLSGDSISGMTVTFYYDDQKAVRGGMDINNKYINTYTGETSPYSTATTAVIDSTFTDYRPTTTAYWFMNCGRLTTISGMEYLNTSNVTDMSFMFNSCGGLTALDVSRFNTANVTYMGGLFSSCSGLTSLDLSHFDTSNVTDMHSMFYDCHGLTSLDLSNFNTSNVTNMASMFMDCSGLTALDASHFNTSKVTGMGSMFLGCSGLASLDVSHFDTSNVTYMEGLFGGCLSLTSLDVSHFNTSKVTTMNRMFSGSSGLTTIYVGSEWSTSNVTDSDNMFSGCTSLIGGKGTVYNADHIDAEYARIDGGPNSETPGYFTDKNAPVVGEPEPYAVLSDSNTVLTFYYDNQKEVRGGMSVGPFDGFRVRGWDEYRTLITTVNFDSSFAACDTLASTAYWFYRCNNIKQIVDIENLKTGNVTDMSYMFYGCSSLTNLTLSGFNTENVRDMNYMFDNCSSLTSLDLSSFNTMNVTRMSNMFLNCSSLTSLDLSAFNTSNVTNMQGMFYGCGGLKSLDLSSFDTSNVRDMSLMFDRCSGLTSLNVSSFNTANVTSMAYMFTGCWGLTSLDLTGFNTTNVAHMNYMFAGCYGLTSLDLGGFNTENVTDMAYMFQSCSGLTSLDLSNFNTTNVKNMQEMFYGCSGLTSLDMSGFNTEQVTNMNAMFDGCSKLTNLDVSSFNTVNVTDIGNMFLGCSALTQLDVSNFNTESVTNMTAMFYGCSSLKKIIASNLWTTENVTSGVRVFDDCSSLVGGKGTTYDASHTDAEYARLDGGPDSETPGYFSLKSLIVATVNGEETLDEVLEEFGGRTEVNRTLAAIVWNKETAITTEDLQGLTNPNLLIYVASEAQAPEGRNNVVVNGVCERLMLTDGNAEVYGNFFAPQAFTARHAEYTHTYTQETPVGGCQGWETLTLPFTVQTVTHGTQGEIAPFAAISGSDDARKPFWLYTTGATGGISFERAAQVEAYRPYLIAMPNNSQYREEYRLNGEVTFAAENAEVQATTRPSAATGQHYTFMPTTLRVAAADSVYALNTQGEGGYLTGSLFVRNSRDVLPFECYVTAGQVQGAPRLLPVKDMMDATTDIADIMLRPSATAADGLYDLGGRKVRQAAKGAIHVQHGRKVTASY